MDDIHIDKEFARVCRALTPDERKRLKADIVASGGARDPLVIWKGHNILLDGHNRHKICTAEGLPFKTVKRAFDSREDAIDWIRTNQCGRRNLNDEEIKYQIGSLYNGRTKGHGGDRKSKDQSDPLKEATGDTTAETVAKETGTSAPSVKRAGKYAKAIDAMESACGSDAAEDLRSGSVKVAQADLPAIATIVDEHEDASEFWQTCVQSAEADGSGRPKVTLAHVKEMDAVMNGEPEEEETFDVSGELTKAEKKIRKAFSHWPKDVRARIPLALVALSKEDVAKW